MFIIKTTAKTNTAIPAIKIFTCLIKRATKQKDTMISNSAVKVPETSLPLTGPPENSCLNFLTTSKNLSYNHTYNIPPTNCEMALVIMSGHTPNTIIMINRTTIAKTIDFGAFLFEILRLSGFGLKNIV